MIDLPEFDAINLPKVLVERIPELADAMDKEAAFWGNYGVRSIGPDTAFSLVLAPFVLDCLKCEDERAHDLLQKTFLFLEELTYSEDDEILSAVDVSFGEQLIADADAYQRAREYMGPRLRETFDLVQSRRDALAD